MEAVKRIEQYIARNRGNASSRLLVELSVALDNDEQFPLEKLYQMDYEAFELAMALMWDWRTDRYYAAEERLIERIKSAAEPESLAAA